MVTQAGVSLTFDAPDKATLIGGNTLLSSYDTDGLRSQKVGATGGRFFSRQSIKETHGNQ